MPKVSGSRGVRGYGEVAVAERAVDGGGVKSQAKQGESLVSIAKRANRARERERERELELELELELKHKQQKKKKEKRNKREKKKREKHDGDGRGGIGMGPVDTAFNATSKASTATGTHRCTCPS
jgi:hypothetical protein